ncbi:hypothetical protein O3M35_002699 [Rhynocoris fuscipes]|uniref:UNC93-like protein MFSD11 n=1 Tax=Rhynocoris fuscipes TaxID=488301 RepID=A0AAW1CMP9_9HEMI
MLAVGNWVAPSVIAGLGPRISMVIGGITYLIYIASFIAPVTWSLYVVSFIMGLGASIIWTAQGNYLTLNSDETTMARNSGVFWALLQCSLLIGNVYVYEAFEGKTRIDHYTREMVSIVLSVICAIGVVILLLLRPAVSADGNVAINRPIGPIKAFTEAVRLLTRKEMLLLCVTFFYTGFELSFWSGVYSSSIGATLSIADKPKQLVGISGVCIGVGEIVGGLLFGLLGKKTVIWGRTPIVLLGFIIHIITFICIFINIPNAASLADTTDKAIINSNVYLALACSCLLGFGDACYNTQVYAALGTIFSDESAPAFAIFKFTQSIAACIAFIYAIYIGLHAQLIILVIFAILGTLTYWATERIVNRRKRIAVSDE